LELMLVDNLCLFAHAHDTNFLVIFCRKIVVST
jgi:hypothetical protein